MKKILIVLTLCCAVVACKKNDVSFSYSPQSPRAGQPVTFSNLSSSGEEWEWTFGDGATSTLKSPSHTFKQPGEYDVILKVDKKNRWTAYKKIVVTDTVPTFVCPDTAFYIFRDYTFTANLYNPYNYTVNYTWYLGDTIAAKDQPSMKYCFTHPAEAEKVKLVVILNQDTTSIERSIRIQNRTTNSVLLRTAQADYRQRIFGDQAEAYAEDETASDMLNAEQDTAADGTQPVGIAQLRQYLSHRRGKAGDALRRGLYLSAVRQHTAFFLDFIHSLKPPDSLR